MTLPIDQFAQINIEQIVDVRLSGGNRYRRNRRLGSRKPYWKISLTTVPLSYEESLKLSAYLDSKLGEFKVFSLNNPLPPLVQRSGVSLVSNAAQNTITAALGGFSPSQQKAVAAGDFIRFSGHPKVYRIVETANANNGGVVTAKVTPPLMQSVPSATIVEYGDSVNFQVSLRDTIEMSVNGKDASYSAYNIDLIEQG